ncbi:MAG: hypothetical protein J0L67_06230 [Cytophagales bacterium]|jgi:hypothetical protein|nr:hypothetical protein [Cytophagales bacterium]
MKFSPTLFFACLFIGCSTTTKEDTATDTAKIETITLVDSTTVMPFSPGYTSEPETIQNFYGYQSYTLTEDERESKIWDILGPLIKQYDTTEFNTISKNYTMPGTEEMPDETLNTSTTVTVTLYYDDAQNLKAVWREYNYEIGESGRFEKINSLFLFDEDLIAFYEDKEESIDMAFQRYKRGVAKSCPDCGVILSAGVSSQEVIVSGNLTDEDFVTLAKAGRNEESILEYAAADSFQFNGNEYIYQTVEPMSQDADYDVFYTANKGYYEKFMKPKLNK